MGALELDGAGNLIIDEDFETVMERCWQPSLCAPQARRRPQPLVYREEVYDGRGQGSRGGLVRELLQRRRWQLHRVVAFQWLGLDRQGDPRPRRFLALLRKVGSVGLGGQQDHRRGSCRLSGCAQGISSISSLSTWSGNNIGLVGAAALRDVLQTDTELEFAGQPVRGVSEGAWWRGTLASTQWFRAPLWKSVSQGGRIFVRSATRRCCVLQFAVAGTLLQDRRTFQSTQPKSHHLSRTSWRQITHRSVIQRAPEHSCQQRLSSCNAQTHGHNIVLLADCQRISHLESTACVVFFA